MTQVPNFIKENKTLGLELKIYFVTFKDIVENDLNHEFITI